MIEEMEKIEDENIREILINIIANKLCEKEKLIIAFVFYEELNVKEIADVLECSEAEVLDLYMRTIKKIEKFICIYINGKLEMENLKRE